jgi:enamine deaminase RidA (YjgF/YER057c/UK114 family)
MGAQTRRVLTLLEEVLEASGSSLENTLRAEVYLVDAADFHEFKVVWMEFFGDDPPARSTVVVGEMHPIPGVLLNLNAVALASDASVKREVINAPDAPQSMDAEHAPHAVKAAPYVFPSAFPATDFETGIPVGKKENFPAYGSDGEMQAHYILQNLSKVMEAAGTSIDQGVKTQFYETDFLNFHDIDAIWASYVGLPPDGLPPCRSSMGCRGFIYPGAIFAHNTMFLVPDDTHKKVETQEGIRWHPEQVRSVHFTPGMWVGDWLHLAGQVPLPDFGVWDSIVRTPDNMPHNWSDIEVQTDFTMVLLGEQLAANGLGLSDVIDARIFLVDSALRDYRGLIRAWDRLFADLDPKPSMSLIPSTTEDGGTGIMIPGPLIEIDLIAKKGGR